jgi:hypothetical protein
VGLWGLLWAYWVVLCIGGVGFSQVLSLVFSAFCVLLYTSYMLGGAYTRSDFSCSISLESNPKEL